MRAPLRLKKGAVLAAETLGALLLVLALYWLFMTFLYTLFPSGTPLREMMAETTERQPGRDATGKRPEAALSSLTRDVRCRRGNSVAWGDAREGMLLYSQDAVQTFDRSGATISFAPGDLLSIGSNSLVVVTRLNEKVEGGPRAYRVQFEGELRGTLSKSKRVALEVATVGHVARVVPGAARFKMSPAGESGASLSVYAGEVRVLGEDRVIRVPANFGLTLKNGVPAGPAVRLPSPPDLKHDNLLYRFRQLPPRVRFAWSGKESRPGEYRFQLSREPRFGECVLDRKVAAPEVVAGTLEPGSYFWRVSRIEDGRESPFSRTGRCDLMQMLKPPALKVLFPEGEVPAGEFRLAGNAEAGSKIYVNGVEVPGGANGEFVHLLQVKPGVNLVRVEAVDVAGNASYASRVIYAREGAVERAR